MKRLLLFTIIFFVSVPSAYALKIGGVELPDTLKTDAGDLLLNGASLRRKFGFKVYAVGLYLQNKSSDSASILSKDEPMALRMHFRMNVPKKKLVNVFYDSMAESAGGSWDKSKALYMGPEKDQVDQFMGWFTSQDSKKDDVWDFIYLPGQGVQASVVRAGTRKIFGVVKNNAFKAILYGIWIKEDPPVGNSIREDLLGLD